MIPILCMITAGTQSTAVDDGALARSVRAAASAGAHLIQVREPGIEAGQLARLVRASLEAVRGTSARVIVNDRLDVALAARAHGVHLRENSITPRDARAIAPRGFLIGRSVHSVEAAARQGREGWLDYLQFGPVYPTPSKPGLEGVGLEALRQAAHSTAVPVLAVGGVDGTTMAAVIEAGAAGLAAIRWWSAGGPSRR
jgi:thiamine-phosphate diphosphorylase